MQTFDPDFDLLEDFPSVCMENSSKSAVHFDSSIKKCQRVNIKSGKKRTTWSCLPEGLRRTGIINGRSEFVRSMGGGSEASAQIEASGAATWSIEMPLACYLSATAYTFLQSIERSATSSSNTMVFRFQFAHRNGVLDRAAVPYV